MTIWLGLLSQIPVNYVLCEGQILDIKNDDVSTSYVKRYGTTYGGNGTTTIGVPDMRGRVLVHQDGSIEFERLGQTGGEKQHILTIDELPRHTHNATANYVDHVQFGGIQDNRFAYCIGGGNQPPGRAVDYEGGNQSHNNIQPYIVGYYIIKIREDGITENIRDLDEEVNSIKEQLKVGRQMITNIATVDQGVSTSKVILELGKHTSIGNKLTGDTNGIVLPAGIKSIIVSANAWYTNESPASYLWLYVDKYRSGTFIETIGSSLAQIVSKWICVSISPKAYDNDLRQGDVILLRAVSNISGGKLSGGEYPNSTYLTVEAIME